LTEKLLFKDPPDSLKRSLEEVAEKHETMKQRLFEIGGETLSKLPPSNLSNITNTAAMMKREYSISGL
jgi:hypothetical protein